MDKMTMTFKEFLKAPEQFLKDARQQQKVLLLHTDNGCLVEAILTKLQYQSLLQLGVV
jgi:hypothetical protein